MRSFIQNGFLLFLLLLDLVLSQPETRCSIHNLLPNPVYIGTQPGNLKDNRSNVDSTPEFTISFWLRFNEIPEGKMINVLSLNNPLPREIKTSNYARGDINSNFPNCPVSPAYLKQNPSYLEDPYIKNNPNCFPRAPKEPDMKDFQPTDYIQRILEVTLHKEEKTVLLFDMPASFDNDSGMVSYITQSLSELEINHNDWVYIAISLDYANGRGLAYVSDLRRREDEFKVNFKLELPELKLKNDYILRYSENVDTENEVYGYLYDINIFYMFMDSLELLRFMNYDDFSLRMQNLRVNLLFDAKNTTQPLISTADNESEFSISGQHVVEPIGYTFKPGSYLQLGSIANYPLKKLVQSATFYFTIKLVNDIADEFMLLKAHKNNSTESFDLKFVRDDSSNTVYYALEAQLSNTNITYRTPRFIRMNEYTSFMFSIIQTAGENTNFYFAKNKKLFDVSPLFKNATMPLVELNYTLFDNKNQGEVQISRFSILDSPLPSIISVQDNKILSGCNKECEMPLDPHVTPRACFACKDSVLFPIDNKCLEFCPPGYKNANGVCVKCFEPKCQEINPATLVISRLNNTAFLLQLTKKVAQLDATNLDKIFSVEIDGLKHGKDYTYALQIGSAKTVLLDVDFKTGLYNATMHVKTNYTEFESLYDENRDFIYSLEGSYMIPSVHYLNNNSKFWSDFFGYLLFAVFLLIILMGAMLFILSFKYNLNEYIVKKISVLFRAQQLTPLLLFLHVAFPSNLHNFLSNIYMHIIGFNSAITPFTESMYLVTSDTPHPNFFDKQLTTLFLQNFGIVFIIHCAITLCYVALLVFSCFYKCLSMTMKEFVLKARDIFEYNFLVIAFILFDYQIFVFANLSFQQPKLNNSFAHFSLIVAIIYITLFVVLSLIYIGLYFIKNRFVPQSDTKFKISFMFIGYRNRPIPNLYEIVILLFHFGTSVILVYLKNHPLPQITTLIAWNIGYFCTAVLMRPFEAPKEGKIDMFNRAILIIILVLIGSLAINDVNQSYDFNTREIIGWIIISVIVFYTLFNFITVVIQLILFLKRIKSSSKLIFYDKEDGFSSINMGKGGKIIGNAMKDDEDIEEKHFRSSALGKLGDLGKIGGDSYFFTENKTKSDNDDLEVKKMKSGKGSGHDSYLSNSDDTFNSQKHSISHELKMQQKNS